MFTYGYVGMRVFPLPSCCCPVAPAGCLWLRCVWSSAPRAGPRGGASPLQHIAAARLAPPPAEICGRVGLLTIGSSSLFVQKIFLFKLLNMEKQKICPLFFPLHMKVYVPIYCTLLLYGFLHFACISCACYNDSKEAGSGGETLTSIQTCLNFQAA